MGTLRMPDDSVAGWSCIPWHFSSWSDIEEQHACHGRTFSERGTYRERQNGTRARQVTCTAVLKVLWAWATSITGMSRQPSPRGSLWIKTALRSQAIDVGRSGRRERSRFLLSSQGCSSGRERKARGLHDCGEIRRPVEHGGMEICSRWSQSHCLSTMGCSVRKARMAFSKPFTLSHREQLYSSAGSTWRRDIQVSKRDDPENTAMERLESQKPSSYQTWLVKCCWNNFTLSS